jgi:hypothetical protein
MSDLSICIIAFCVLTAVFRICATKIEIEKIRRSK